MFTKLKIQINNEQQNKQENAIGNTYLDINFFNPINYFIMGTHSRLLRIIAITKLTIPATKLKVNNFKSIFLFLNSLKPIGKMIATPNHPAERLINRSEIACNHSITFSVYHNFAGQLDDVRIYNYALTATQIRTIMNEGAVRFGPVPVPVTGSP